MKRFLALACFAALLAGATALGETQTDKASLSASGEVTAVKAELRQVSVRSGEGTMFVFQINDKTRITRDGKPVTLSTISVGDQVTVSYEKAGDVNVAVSIGVTETQA